jgi:hypothetical protein
MYIYIVSAGIYGCIIWRKGVVFYGEIALIRSDFAVDVKRCKRVQTDVERRKGSHGLP